MPGRRLRFIRRRGLRSQFRLGLGLRLRLRLRLRSQLRLEEGGGVGSRISTLDQTTEGVKVQHSTSLPKPSSLLLDLYYASAIGMGLGWRG